MTTYQKLDLAMRFERAIEGLFVDPLGPDLDIETLAELLLLWMELRDLGVPVDAEVDAFFDRMESDITVRNIDDGVDESFDRDDARRMYTPPALGWMRA